MKKILTALAAVLSCVVATAGFSIATAGTAAAAAPRNGVCESGEFCLYYNGDHSGGMVDVVNSNRNYGTGSGCLRFVTGAHRGECVKNRVASVRNKTGKRVFVFYNSDFGGVYDQIPIGASPRLNDNVRKDNASHIIGNALLRFPLNVTQSHIKNRTPAWCWNSKTNCHHHYNASDIFAAEGKRVVSPVHGVVKTVRVRTRACPGTTVTVKDKFGRLWYFAHMRGGSSYRSPVHVGERVSKGELLGYVGNRTQACGTPPHLHIDMRVGANERIGCSGAGCIGKGFVNNQPLLRTAFFQRPA